MFELVSCSLGSCDRVMRKDLSSHESSLCKFRMINCRLCQLAMRFHQEEDHIKQTCPNKEILCDLLCGASLHRQALESHKMKVCSEFVVMCPYIDDGCDRKMKRKDLDQHLSEREDLHMMLRVTKMSIKSLEQEVGKQFNVVNSRIDAVDARVKSVEDDLAKLRSSIPVAVPAAIPRLKEFTHKSDFDENGVLFWMGTAQGQQAWRNPCSIRWIGLTISHAVDTSYGGMESIVGREGQTCRWGGTCPQFFVVDLKRKLQCTAFTLRDGNQPFNGFMRDWTFSGSNDNSTWTVLHQQANTAFSRRKESKTWLVDGKESFRFFRVLQKGLNASGMYPYLWISGFELYGKLMLDEL